VALSLRPVTAADADLVLGLFLGAGGQALTLARLPQAQVEALLRMQVAAQDRHYRTHHPESEHSVVLLDGVPVGRLWVAREETALHLLDITLLPEHRGRGLGSALIRDLLTEASVAGLPVRLHVAVVNPAESLYRRLGFIATGGDEVHREMVWTPVTQARAAG
jgi:ribosomal protein S18 acetylase RimI-like enzyme